jgi:hypothetical protein
MLAPHSMLPTVADLAKLTVLVVENEKLASTLEDGLAPVAVMHADNVPEAMEYILFSRPEVIVFAGSRQDALHAALQEEAPRRVYITHDRLTALGGDVPAMRWLLQHALGV